MKMEKEKLLDEKERLMMELGKDLEESFNLDDEDFFYDRVLFMKENYENDSETYKSNKPSDKRMIKNYCREYLVILINQFLRFKRFPYTTNSGVVYNFPKGEMPNFYLNDMKQNTLKENLEIFDYEDPLYR